MYQAAEKSGDSTIVFQGELFPWSNFHKVPFVINGQRFLTSEHWIQFQKALLFNDSVTADRILQCDTCYKAKMLEYQVQGMDNRKWLEKGYTICLEKLNSPRTQT